MSPHGPAHLIEKAVQRFEHATRDRVEAVPPRRARVITISRQLGSGGRRIAQALSERLGWPLWDREILDVIASQSQLHYQSRLFEALDERAQSNIDALGDSLLGSVDKHVYMHLLPRAILIIAQNDGIILGRGAHLLLPGALRVRVVASMETRVRNLVRYEGFAEDMARKAIKASDHEREAFVQELARRLRHSLSESEKDIQYDLAINTDNFGVQGSSVLILAAARQKLGAEVTA